MDNIGDDMNAATTALLFPGQGSQFVGMGREFLADDEDAGRLMAMAGEISGLPLTSLCLDGPMEDLTRTLHLQPAMTAINLVCLQALKKAGVEASFCAGHSLGEYSALVAAGVLTPESAIRLVTERGRLMERESKKNPGAMSAILKLDIDQVQDIVSQAGSQGVVVAANYNSAGQIVISGEEKAVAAASALAGEQGGRAIPLPVSGAWHSPLIEGAVADFEDVMAGIDFQTPVRDIVFNVTAAPETEPGQIRKIMSNQIASMVRWYEIILSLRQHGVSTFIEVGPKKVLSGMLKKILPGDKDYRSFQVENPETLADCLAGLS